MFAATPKSSFAAGLALIALLSGCAIASDLNLDAPASFTFGANLEAMIPSFDTACTQYEIRELDPAELPIAQNSHQQVDCRGFKHAGATRFAEFVFADDSLAFVWLLTEAEEESGFIENLEAQFGTPSHETPMFVAFADHNLALRRDTPELLYYGDHVAPMYRGWFDQMSTQ